MVVFQKGFGGPSGFVSQCRCCAGLVAYSESMILSCIRHMLIIALCSGLNAFRAGLSVSDTSSSSGILTAPCESYTGQYDPNSRNRETHQHRANPPRIARSPLIMTVQRPINLPPQLNFSVRHHIRLFKTSRIQIQSHIKTQSVRHPKIQPACGVSANCLFH